MKTLQLIRKLRVFIGVTVVLLFGVSCSKGLNHSKVLDIKESIVTFNIAKGGSTKAIGTDYETAVNYNGINTLEFFIFNAEGNAAKGTLDAYKKFTTADGLTNLEVKSTTGAKNIYVVANSHRADWKGVTTLVEFQEQVSNLSAEDIKDLTMVGSIDATLQPSTSLTLGISRLVAKINLASIKTTFAGTPYDVMKLENVKAYLTNVHSSKLFHNGEIATPIILNSKKCIEADVNSCKFGVLYDAIPTSIGDAGYNTSHYFFAYENKLETETTDDRFTRLVIEADLDGITYYYPININQEGYGYDAGNGHKGIQRNTEYAINVTIKRPGSTDPDTAVEPGVLTASVTVIPWKLTTTANPEF